MEVTLAEDALLDDDAVELDAARLDDNATLLDEDTAAVLDELFAALDDDATELDAATLDDVPGSYSLVLIFPIPDQVESRTGTFAEGVTKEE